jgi:hypothetical protein
MVYTAYYSDVVDTGEVYYSGDVDIADYYIPVSLTPVKNYFTSGVDPGESM